MEYFGSMRMLSYGKVKVDEKWQPCVKINFSDC